MSYRTMIASLTLPPAEWLSGGPQSIGFAHPPAVSHQGESLVTNVHGYGPNSVSCNYDLSIHGVPQRVTSHHYFSTGRCNT